MDILTLTGAATLPLFVLPQDSSSTLAVALSLGQANANLLLLSQLWRQSMEHKHKPPRKQFGFVSYFEILSLKSQHHTQRLYTVTIKEQLHSPRIPNTTLERSILEYNTIGFESGYKRKRSSWSISQPTDRLLTGSLSHFQSMLFISFGVLLALKEICCRNNVPGGVLNGPLILATYPCNSMLNCIYSGLPSYSDNFSQQITYLTCNLLSTQRYDLG